MENSVCNAVNLPVTYSGYMANVKTMPLTWFLVEIQYLCALSSFDGSGSGGKWCDMQKRGGMNRWIRRKLCLYGKFVRAERTDWYSTKLLNRYREGVA